MPVNAGHEGALPLQLDGFELDVQGRAQHAADDTFDATWLSGAATCDSDGSRVSIPAVVVTSWSIQRFREGLDELLRTHTGCALLAAEGPELSVCVQASQVAGKVTVRVDLTPQHETQGHWFAFEMDESRLTSALAQCGAILNAFPTRDMADAHDTFGHSAS